MEFPNNGPGTGRTTLDGARFQHLTLDAINYAAENAKLTDYEVRIVPEPKNFIERLLEEIAGEKDEPKGLGLQLRAALADRQPSLVELALPYLQHLDPQRVKAVKMALLRLQLMQQEGAVLMMPEIVLPN